MRPTGPKVAPACYPSFPLSGAQLAGCGLQTRPAATKVLRCPPVIRVFPLSGTQLAGRGLETRPAAITAEQPLRVELHQLVALQ